MEWLTVALFSSRNSAETIRGRLTEAGFDARIAEETGLQRLWFVRKAEGGISLDVPGDEFEDAEGALLEWDTQEHALRDVIRCPECRSLRVQYPQFARHSLLTNFFIGLAAVIGMAEKDYYCEQCHCTWPKEGHRPRRNRPHMAPYYFISGVEQTTLVPPRPGNPEENQRAA